MYKRQSEGGIRYYSPGNVEFGRVLSVGKLGSDGGIMGLRVWRPTGGLIDISNQSYLGLHANSIEGYKIQLATSTSGNGNLMEITPTATRFTLQGVGVEKGLLVGSAEATPPTAGVIRFAQRADSSTYPDSTQVDLFSRTVGGVQKLYAKFGSGVVREIATA